MRNDIYEIFYLDFGGNARKDTVGGRGLSMFEEEIAWKALHPTLNFLYICPVSWRNNDDME